MGIYLEKKKKKKRLWFKGGWTWDDGMCKYVAKCMRSTAFHQCLSWMVLTTHMWQVKFKR